MNTDELFMLFISLYYNSCILLKKMKKNSIILSLLLIFMSCNFNSQIENEDIIGKNIYKKEIDKTMLLAERIEFKILKMGN